MDIMSWLKSQFSNRANGINPGPFADSNGPSFLTSPDDVISRALVPKISPLSDPNAATNPGQFSSARAAGAEDILGSTENNSWTGSNPLEQGPSEQELFFKNLMAQVLAAGQQNGEAAASAASAAYNPAISALNDEISSAKRRGKEDKAQSRIDFKGAENEYRLARRNEVATKAKQTKRTNEDLAKSKVATQQEYTKKEAQQQADLAARGIGQSAQALAQEQLVAQSAQAIDAQEAMATAHRNVQSEMSDSQQRYLSAAIPNTRVARTEAAGELSRILEGTLQGLNKEKAGLLSQAAQSAQSARKSAQVDPLAFIQAQLGIFNAAKDAEMSDAELALKMAQNGGAPADYGQGAQAAQMYLMGQGFDSQTVTDLMNALNNDPVLEKGYAGDAVTKDKITPAVIRRYYTELAQKNGWSQEELDAAIIAASMDAGIYSAPKGG